MMRRLRGLARSPLTGLRAGTGGFDMPLAADRVYWKTGNVNLINRVI